MARVAFSLTLLLLLFAFTYARTAFDFPENDVTDGYKSVSVAKSDPTPMLLLPSEKMISEPTSMGEMEPETAKTESAGVEIDAESGPAIGAARTTVDLRAEPETQTLDLARPLTMARYRPVNRHFRRGCHHGIKPMNPMMVRPQIQRRERSYGNDMIILGDERKEFDPEMFRGDGVRQIQPQWMNFHHHHQHQHHHDHDGMPWFPSKHHDHDHDHHHDHDDHDDDRFARQSFRKPFRRDEREEREDDDDEREEREHEGGFLNQFRKFLHHF